MSFGIGLIVGVILGVSAMCLCMAAKKGDNE